MGYNMFLSHSSKDGPWAKWLASNAGDFNIGVWLFEDDPQPGKSIDAKLEQNILASDALVVLLTPHSVKSPLVQQEIGIAKTRRKLIIPLVHPSIKKENYGISSDIEHIDFDYNNQEKASGTLCNYLDKLRKNKELAEGVLIVAGFAAAFILLLAVTAKK